MRVKILRDQVLIFRRRVEPQEYIIAMVIKGCRVDLCNVVEYDPFAFQFPYTILDSILAKTYLSSYN